MGYAWELGVLKALHDAGVDVTQTYLIVGTSAGANLGTRVRAGRTLDSLYDALFATLSSPAPSAGEPAFDAAYVQEIGQLFRTATERGPALRMQIGQRALAATKVISEEAQVQSAVMYLGNINSWPAQPLKITAADVSDGTIRFFDSSQGVPIERAIAATNAIPGMIAPITIGDRRYMDGAVSGANIEGAAGANIILVLTPAGNPARTEREVELARSNGSQVLNVSPDADGRAAMGPNNQDRSKQVPTVQAGIRQGGSVAAQVKSFWSKE